jgi:RsmE family RNA methyltransferase
MNLILIDDDESGGAFPVADPRARHLVSILRAEPGDEFAAGILGGNIGRIHILQITEEEISFRFISEGPPPPLYPLEIIIGAPRPLVSKRLLKDLSSLGLGVLHFVSAELGEKSYLSSGLWTADAYVRHLREGAEQASSTLLPEVRLHGGLRACLGEFRPGGPRFVLDPARENRRLMEADFGTVSAGRETAVLAVGPERGWTERELLLFRAAGFEGVRLGQRILRTEAAALIASAIALSRMGYM